MIAAALGVAFLAGFISISWEILFFRVYSLATGGLPLVFGMMLSAFLSGVAIGSLAAGRWSERHPRGDPRLLERTGVLLAGASAAGYLALPIIGAVVTDAHWILSLPVVAVTAGCLGAVLPIIAQYSVTAARESGPLVGALYLANILGSVSGGLATGFLLLEWLPMQSVALALAIATLVSALLMIGASGRLRSQRAVTAFIVTAGIAYPLLAASAFDELHEKLQRRKSYTPGNRFQNVVENRSGVITVTKSREVFGGGAYDGMISTSLRDDDNGIVRAYAVAAFHASPKRVLMIGLATGAWAQVIANIPAVNSLTVIEINPGYLELIPKYPEVASLLRNPKVRVVIDDGRRWLNQNPGARFDFIVANTTFHWRAHSTNLLSSDYLRIVREHLLPGGIYYYNTTRSDDALLTGLTVFPQGARFLNMAVLSERPVAWDAARMRETLVQMSIDAEPVLNRSVAADVAIADSLAALGVQSGPEPLALEQRESVLRRLSGATVITDDNMISEWRGAPLRRFFGKLAQR